MLRREEKYLPGPQEHDGANTKQTSRRRKNRQPWKVGATVFEAPSEAGLAAASDPRIARVLSAIGDNPFVTIADLSRRVNLSHSRLSHLFKAAQGVSLNRFLSDRRVERAAQLLSSTEMQIKEITYDAGYKQVPSFVRAFHEDLGKAPRVTGCSG